MKLCKFCKKPGKFDKFRRLIVCKNHSEPAEVEELEQLLEMFQEVKHMNIAG